MNDWLADQRVRPLPDGVHEAQIGGVRCIVKVRRPGAGRALGYGLRYLRALALAVFCKLVLGEFPSPRVLLRNGLADETRRLRALRAQAWPVPQVYAAEPGLLVLEFVGQDLPHLLRRAPPAQCAELVFRAGADLARFHRAGHWHGGAQLRNMTLRDGRYWRIDFEENIGGALSLPLAQAYDLLQACLSLTGMNRLPEHLLPALGRQLLQGYLSEAGPEQTGPALRRVARSIAGTERVLRPLTARLSWRDVRGFRLTADLMRVLLKP
ncbi:hypothetical protein V8Z80_16360 [Orrella sp. JC864]|uniref:hypothetical protein n=1 Tax=Orrella sp. JC864 TaxID=3120298 RepID=UPI00300A8A2D